VAISEDDGDLWSMCAAAAAAAIERGPLLEKREGGEGEKKGGPELLRQTFKRKRMGGEEGEKVDGVLEESPPGRD